MLTLQNIDGIEKALDQDIKNLGNEAFKAYVKLFKSPVTSTFEFDSSLKWYTKVFTTCARELHDRGVLSDSQYDSTLDKFYNTKLLPSKGGK